MIWTSIHLLHSNKPNQVNQVKTSFFRRFMAQARSPKGHKSMEKNEENGILNIDSCSRKLSGWKQYPRTMAGMFHINILTYELNKQSCR